MVTTSKQDRGSVKTASDLEQKYDLASISTMKVAIENSEDGLNKTNTTLEEFMNATVKSLEDLQDQVDGNITTWFFNGIPTLENAPANEWTTEEDKINHLGDLYYDQDTGYAYRFSMINNAYEWAKITDTDVVKALALANSAQDTADSKRRVFVSTPVPPYDSGDLWFKDSEIYICQISKDKDQVYAEKDFIIATKYTDDTYAKQVGNELKVLSGTVTTIKEGVDQFEVDITTRVDGLDEDLTVAQTDLEMVQGQISAKVWQADIDIEKSTSTSSGSQILLTDSADGKVIDFSAYGRSEQNGTPTPDNPIEIVSVGDSGTLEVKSCGKNLLQNTHKATTLNGISSVLNADGSITFNGLSTGDAFFSVGKYNFKVGKTYIMNGCPSGGNFSNAYSLYTNIDGAYKSDIGTGVTITPQSNSENNITILFRKGISVSNLTFYPMIRLAEVEDDTYEPNKETVTYIPLTEPLRSVGEVKDEISCVDGVYGVIRRIASKRFTTVFKNQGSNSNNYGYYQRFGNVGGSTVLSDKLSYKPMNTILVDGATMDTLGISATPLYGGVVYLNVGYYLTDNTVEGITAWLSDNPITVQYELATETFEPFADQTPFRNITTYNPVTYITNSDDALMEVEYYRNSFNGQTLANTSAELEMKIGRDENNQIVSMINASADEINLKSNRFSLESDNTTITKDGKITTGELNANGGEIGGWEISENGISKETEAYVPPIDKHAERIKQYLINEVELSDAELQYYDVNGDGIVNIKDALRIRRYNRGEIEYKDAENAMESSLTITFNPKDGTKTLKFESINPIGELIEAYIGAAQCKFPSIIGDYLNVSDIYGKEITGTTITGENVVTGAGANLDDKLNSTVINIDSSNTKTVRITVPSGFYIEGIYANRTYYILPSPLLYFDSLIAAYGGNTIPYAIGGVVDGGSAFSLITSVMTPNTSSSYAVLPTVNSAIISDNVLTISLKLSATSSIMSLNSNIKIV